ncbi:MAG: sulfite exporter TauE/SafE family protein, partial [Actinomycetes bacterium]
MVFVWTAFITGLLAGGASCAAVQGGLLAGLAARKLDRQKAESVEQSGVAGSASSGAVTRTAVADTSVRADAMTVVVFLIGKLAVYTLLGFGLGLLGKAIEITPQVQAIMLILAGILMLIMALDLFGVKAVRAFVPTPPASWTRVVRKRSKDTGHLAPLLLGVSTVLLPCGITISMEIAAIATGSPWLGAAIMAAFVIGTMPLFFIIGLAAHRLTGAWGGRLAVVAGVAVLVAALLAINGGLTLAGSPVT